MKMLLYKSLGALKDHGRGGLSLRTLTPFVVRGCSQKEGAGIYLDNLIFISNLHTMGPILAEGGVKVNGAPHTEGSLITKEASFSGDSVLPATEESGVSITVSDVPGVSGSEGKYTGDGGKFVWCGNDYIGVSD